MTIDTLKNTTATIDPTSNDVNDILDDILYETDYSDLSYTSLKDMNISITIDPWNWYNNISYSGRDGHVEAQCDSNSPEISFVLDKESGLSSGDEIQVIANLSEVAQSSGFVLINQDLGKFTVPPIYYYFSNIDELTDNDIDNIVDMVQRNWEDIDLNLSDFLPDDGGYPEDGEHNYETYYWSAISKATEESNWVLYIRNACSRLGKDTGVDAILACRIDCYKGNYGYPDSEYVYSEWAIVEIANIYEYNGLFYYDDLYYGEDWENVVNYFIHQETIGYYWNEGYKYEEIYKTMS